MTKKEVLGDLTSSRGVMQLCLCYGVFSLELWQFGVLKMISRLDLVHGPQRMAEIVGVLLETFREYFDGLAHSRQLEDQDPAY